MQDIYHFTVKGALTVITDFTSTLTGSYKYSVHVNEFNDSLQLFLLDIIWKKVIDVCSKRKEGFGPTIVNVREGLEGRVT